MHSRALVSLKVLVGVALAGAFLWGQSLMAQSKIVVGNCTNASQSYTRIQDAVANAAPGSTVLICPGTYHEQVVITEPLALIGLPSDNYSFSPVRIAPPLGGVSVNATVTMPKPQTIQPIIQSVAAQIWVHDTTRVTLSNLTVDGTGNEISSSNCNLLIGIYVQNASGTIQHVVTQNQQTGTCFSGFGALVESDSSLASRVTVRDSSFSSWDGWGFWAQGSGTNVRFQSNTVEGPAPGGSVNDVTYERAAGTIESNSLINALTKGSAAGDLATASCGIGLVLASPAAVTVSGNVIGNTQCGVALYDTDGATIASNIIFDTRENDGVYVCGDGNTVRDNTISDSYRAGIFLSCADVSSTFPNATVNNNKISNNTINGAGIGVLFQISTAGNQLENNNEFFNVLQTVEHLVGG